MPRTLVSGLLFFASIATLAAVVSTASTAYGQHTHHAAPKVAPNTSMSQSAKTPSSSTSAMALEKPDGSYQPFNAAEPLVDWRLANDKVHEIGGWRAYAKEAARAAKARDEARKAAQQSATAVTGVPK